MGVTLFSLQLSSSKQPLPTVPLCGICKLYKSCESPKMGVSGKGKKKILIVGEAPGADEDSQGKPFVGKSGQLLQETLLKLGIEFRRDCWITNALICRPKSNKIEDNKVIDYCRPNLMDTIKRLQPEIIIPLGYTAVKSLIGWLWKDDPKTIGRWVGWKIPNQRLNCWICPTWHPSALLRNESKFKQSDPMKIHWENHLKEAVSLVGRPYETIPNYKKNIHLIYDHKEACSAINEWIDIDHPIAFDYESTTLKPDGKYAKLLCCSLSDGETSIAFPWHGMAITEMKDFLRSKTPKISHNAKHEARWTRKEFGCSVRNFAWDSMLAAHTLDNRHGVCGLKFLSFTMLGQESYDDEVETYKSSEGGNTQNTLHKFPVDKLLTYCALDSLLTHKIATIQMKELGYV